MPDGEMRDIKFPRPRKPRPFLAPLPRPPRKAPRARKFAAWFVLLAVLAAGGAYLLKTYWPVRRSPVENVAAVPWSGLLQALRQGGAAYGGLQNFSGGLLDLLNLADQMQARIPAFLAGRDTGLPQALTEAKTKFQQVLAAMNSLSAAGADQSKFFGDYLSWRRNLENGYRLSDGLESLLNSSPDPHHLIIVLGNTAELRPGGGFAGSFADAEISGGILRRLTVHDINEVDRTRNTRIVPPKPLQVIASNWRAADANWFFDFPASAGKTLEFMSQSALYATSRLDGLAAVTPRVVKDILATTGPLTLPSGATVNADNFLDLIQSEVQAGQAAQNPAPKAVLQEIAPLLTKALAGLDAGGRDALLSKVPDWIAHKDLMIYMKNPELAGVLGNYGADGALYALPDNFEGDYLAVTDANIGGNKSDRYMSRQFDFQSVLGADGAVRDRLTVTRANDAPAGAEWWYRAVNWDYLQIFVPNGITLTGAEGLGRRILPHINYAGYAVDPDVADVEQSAVVSGDGKLTVYAESGRTVLATWEKVAAGDSKTVTLSYTRQLTHPLAAGDKYAFIFESQSGAPASLHAVITAPVGFVWTGNNSPIYELKQNDPPGRLVLELALAPAPH